MKIIEYNQKKYPYLEVYDSGAMFIGSYVLKLLLQVGIVIFLALTGVPDTFTSTLGGICLITSLNEIAFALTPIAYGKIKGRNLLFDMGFEQKFSPSIALLCIPLSVAVICLGSPLASGFIKLVELIGYDMSAVASVSPDTPGELVLTLFFVALLPAFAEEYLFRGNIARGLAKNGYLYAIFMSAFIFAIMHGNPLQLVHQFILGVVCAVLYCSTKSLFPSIILHFCNNAFALIIEYVNVTGGHNYLNFTEPWKFVVMCLVGIVATAGIMFAILVLAKRYSQKHKVAPADNIDTVVTERTAAKNAAEEFFDDVYKPDAEREYENEKQRIFDERIATAQNEAAMEVLYTEREKAEKKEKIRNRRALIYSIIVALAVWIISFIINVV